MEVHDTLSYDHPDRIDPGMLVNPDEKIEESRMKKVEGLIPESIYTALYTRLSTDKETMDHLLSVSLAQYLDQPLHTRCFRSLLQQPS